MTLNNIKVTGHFLQRIRQRNIPYGLVYDCLKYGKRIKTKKDIKIDNDLITCCLSLIDKAAITIKYSKKFKYQIERDARRYDTSKEHIAGLYFESLGYKN